MLKEGIEILKTAFVRAAGDEKYIMLYLISLAFLYVFLKNKEKRTAVITYSIVSIIIIFNPILPYALKKFLTDGVYWRLFWNIPIGISIAYMFTELVFSEDKKYKQWIIGIVAIGIIIYSGTIIYTKNVFQKVNNWYKIPDEEIAITEIILNENNENPKVFVPPEMVAHIRQLDSRIKLSYNRIPSGNYTWHGLLNLMNSKNYDKSVEELIKSKVDFLVWYENDWIKETEEIKLIGSTKNYYIYRIIDNNH